MRPQFTQPAMLVAGIATWRVWQEQGGASPAVVAGHSLGEFTALVCAQALSLHDAVQLVRHRGLLMQQAVPEGEGAMAAILGLEDEAGGGRLVRGRPGRSGRGGELQLAGQVVIAGHATRRGARDAPCQASAARSARCACR